MEKKTDSLGRRLWSPYEEGTLNGLWIANLNSSQMSELLNSKFPGGYSHRAIKKDRRV